MPTSIGYSTSTNPMGPFKHGGIIVDNDHSDPGVWNNHGSVAEYKGQWYVFYHRSTHGGERMRKACVEPIEFNEDGSIPEVEMTSQGAAKPFPAKSRIDAERACLLHGNVRIKQIGSEPNEMLSEIKNENRAVYKYIDFDDKPEKVSLRISDGDTHGVIRICLDSPWSSPVAEVKVEEGSNPENWKIVSGDMAEVSGIHAVWLIFSTWTNDDFSVDWFSFE